MMAVAGLFGPILPGEPNAFFSRMDPGVLQPRDQTIPTCYDVIIVAAVRMRMEDTMIDGPKKTYQILYVG